MRLIGPNCLGMYSHARRDHLQPRSGPRQAATSASISQSGGLGTDIIRRGITRGLKFSGVVTVGNCADLGPSDLLEFYLADDADQRDRHVHRDRRGTGGGCSRSCARRKRAKPVVILKGGRTQLGTTAAASHTGSLAGDDRAWVALSRQTGCVLVETLDEFIDTLLTFQALTPQPQQPDAARRAVRQRRRRERARDRFFRPLRASTSRRSSSRRSTRSPR